MDPSINFFFTKIIFQNYSTLIDRDQQNLSGLARKWYLFEQHVHLVTVVNAYFWTLLSVYIFKTLKLFQWIILCKNKAITSDDNHMGFDIFFDLRRNKRLSKQPRLRRFQTPSRSLWRDYLSMVVLKLIRISKKGLWLVGPYIVVLSESYILTYYPSYALFLIYLGHPCLFCFDSCHWFYPLFSWLWAFF